MITVKPVIFKALRAFEQAWIQGDFLPLRLRVLLTILPFLFFTRLDFESPPFGTFCNYLSYVRTACVVANAPTEVISYQAGLIGEPLLFISMPGL